MARKQIIQIEITRDDWRELKIPWVTSVIADALQNGDASIVGVSRIEVKNVKKHR